MVRGDAAHQATGWDRPPPLRRTVIVMWTAIVGIDGSTGAERALRWAVALAQHRGGAVTAVHAYPVPANLDPRLAQQVDEEAARLADEVVSEAISGIGEAPVRIDREIRAVSEGNTAQALLEAASDADLIVSGSRGIGGFFGLVMGSVSMQLVSHAPCPVGIVPGADRGGEPVAEGGRVLVGVDGSEHARRAVDWAVDEVRRGGGTLVMVAASDDVREREGKETIEKLRAHVPDDVAVEEQPVIGTPAEVLINRSGDARLTVVGSRGRGGFRGMLLGSVGLQLAQHAQSPVVIVRGD